MDADLGLSSLLDAEAAADLGATPKSLAGLLPGKTLSGESPRSPQQKGQAQRSASAKDALDGSPESKPSSSA
eukprot:3069263-Alexandrium_andersonii.AAC.1